MRFICWLLLAQTIGIYLAAVFAAVEIETICLSGPVLSGTGALIALLSFHGDRVIGLLFGLAAPTVTVFVFLLICVFNWTQDDAYLPVSAFLFLFAALCSPACSKALEELLAANAEQRRGSPFQYSIAALLVVMLALSLILSLAQTAGDEGIAVGVFLAYVVVLIYVLNRFFNNRRLQKLAEVSSFLEPGQSSADRRNMS